jgi:hypothetical protein
MKHDFCQRGMVYFRRFVFDVLVFENPVTLTTTLGLDVSAFFTFNITCGQDIPDFRHFKYKSRTRECNPWTGCLRFLHFQYNLRTGHTRFLSLLSISLVLVNITLGLDVSDFLYTKFGFFVVADFFVT